MATLFEQIRATGRKGAGGTKVATDVDIPTVPVPAWWASLASLGWEPPTLATIATIQTARGSGFLGTTYPNVLTVLKAGPSHPAAGKVVRLLGEVAGVGANTCGGGGDGGQPQQVSQPPAGPVCVRSWPSLALADESARLSAQMADMVNQGAGWYALTSIVAFERAIKACDIARARAAYCAVTEKFMTNWLVVRDMRRAVEEMVRGEEERAKWSKSLLHLA